MKALVTGITGFAGGHLAAHLLALGDQLLGTSRGAAVCTLHPWQFAKPGRLSEAMDAARQASILGSLDQASAEAQSQIDAASNPMLAAAGEVSQQSIDQYTQAMQRAQAAIANAKGLIGGLAKSLPAVQQPLRTATIPLVLWDVTEPAPGVVLDRIAAFAPDVIFHLAAESVPSKCSLAGQSTPTPEAWTANVGSVSNVLAMAEALPRRPRVVILSSSQVYAPAAPNAGPLSEDFAVAPVNGYGKTKLAAEGEALRAVEGGLQVIIARAFNHTGPGQWPPLMLPEWCEQLASGSDSLRIQSSNSWIDLTDVRDTVRAYRLLAERGVSGTAYNIGSGVSRRTGDILMELFELAGPRQVIETNPRTIHGPAADTRRLQKATGWKPEVSLQEMLTDTLAWWRTAPRRSLPHS